MPVIRALENLNDLLRRRKFLFWEGPLSTRNGLGNYFQVLWTNSQLWEGQVYFSYPNLKNLYVYI